MYEKFTWTKDDSAARMRFWDQDGNELIVNPGRSYIAVINTYQADTLVFDDPPFEEPADEESDEDREGDDISETEDEEE